MSKNFIWRGEEITIDEKKDSVNSLAEELSQVFKNGFTQNALDKEILRRACKPPLSDETYVTASSIKRSSNGEFIGRDNELFSAGTYGYIYLVKANDEIETSRLEKGSYAISSKVDPRFIVGAMPSAFVAFALGIDEQSFIMNSRYQGQGLDDDLKKRLAIKICITPDNFSKKYSEYSLENIYTYYLRADKLADIVTAFFKQNQGVGLAYTEKTLPSHPHP